MSWHARTFANWNDSSVAFQEMAEAQNGALLVLHVVGGSHRDVRVTEHLLRGSEPIAGVDLRAKPPRRPNGLVTWTVHAPQIRLLPVESAS
jgi:hypothetical protein